MTQNNERVDITPLQQVNAVQSIREAKTLDDALRVMNGLAANGWLKLWDSATHPDGTSWRDKSPISQNEQQEAVTNLWEALGKWSAYLASNGEQANLAPPSWLIDAVSSATSPHKQIPDGWKLVPIEPNERMLDIGESNYQYGEPSSYKAGLVYKAMLNASPTTSLTSETNTEVVE